MHMFISKTFVDGIGVHVNDLGYDLVVYILAKAILTTGVSVNDIPVVIQWCILFMDLTTLAIREFNAIFGVD